MKLLFRSIGHRSFIGLDDAAAAISVVAAAGAALLASCYGATDSHF